MARFPSLAALLCASVIGGTHGMTSYSFSYDFDDVPSYLTNNPSTLHFMQALAEGDSVPILETGPFSLDVACSTIPEANGPEVHLVLTITAGEEPEWIYGAPAFASLDLPEFQACVGQVASGESKQCIIASIGAGNVDNKGAFASLSGAYVGFDGDSLIGLHRDYFEPFEENYYTDYTEEDIAALPPSVDCLMSGTVTYVENM